MNLVSLGWNRRLASLYRQLDHENLEPGRIVRVDRGGVVAATAAGDVRAVLAGRLDPRGEAGPAAVGDWAALDCREGTAVVRGLVTRTTALTRRAAGGERTAQVLAANLDLVLVVEPVDRGPNPRRIERALALAWEAGATPVVVLTKCDLADDVTGALAAAGAAAPFVEIVPVSAASGRGLDALGAHLAVGTTAVLLGASGAGKSTLANAFLGAARYATAAVRPGDRRGRHTTTRRELVVLPAGGCLVDTPGVRELGLWLGAAAVDGSFPELAELASECRYCDCRHEAEPDCAVVAAVERGELDAARLDSYRRLRREVDRLERIQDPLGRAEQRARDRSFARICRAEKERRRRE